jgi:hypothetical protein
MKNVQLVYISVFEDILTLSGGPQTTCVDPSTEAESDCSTS